MQTTDSVDKKLWKRCASSATSFLDSCAGIGTMLMQGKTCLRVSGIMNEAQALLHAVEMARSSR